jgi:hypothetical protein
MAGMGDYTKNRVVFKDASTNLVVLAGTGDTTLITARNTSHTVFVQRIIAYITTNAAQSWSFEDSAGFQIAEIPTSPGDSTRWDFDFGPRGVPLTAGANFLLNVSAAGLAGHIEVDAYQRFTPGVAVAAAGA